MWPPLRRVTLRGRWAAVAPDPLPGLLAAELLAELRQVRAELAALRARLDSAEPRRLVRIAERRARLRLLADQLDGTAWQKAGRLAAILAGFEPAPAGLQEVADRLGDDPEQARSEGGIYRVLRNWR